MGMSPVRRLRSSSEPEVTIISIDEPHVFPDEAVQRLRDVAWMAKLKDGYCDIAQWHAELRQALNRLQPGDLFDE